MKYLKRLILSLFKQIEYENRILKKENVNLYKEYG
jgi:hypothetical protein